MIEQVQLIQQSKPETDLINSQVPGAKISIIAARCIKPVASETVRLAHSLTIFMICLDRGELTR